MLPRKKHVPQRTCIACKKVKNKHDLIRLVKTSDQTIIVDLIGKVQGRGAYLCKQLSCWQKRLNKNIVGRALKMSVSNDMLTKLQQYIKNCL